MAWFSFFGASKSPSIEEQYETVNKQIAHKQELIYTANNTISRYNDSINNPNREYDIVYYEGIVEHNQDKVDLYTAKLDELESLKLELFYQLPDEQ